MLGIEKTWEKNSKDYSEIYLSTPQKRVDQSEVGVGHVLSKAHDKNGGKDKGNQNGGS